MNIFILSLSENYETHIELQAAFHCDKHVIKMIAEYVQMLSTALAAPRLEIPPYIRLLANRHPPACKATHANHPCTQWVMRSLYNFEYLARLAHALCIEKRHRWPLSAPHIYEAWLEELLTMLPETGCIPLLFPVAIPDCDKSTKRTGLYVFVSEASQLYRQYYVTHKSSFATWKNRPTPMWYLRMQEELKASQPQNLSR